MQASTSSSPLAEIVYRLKEPQAITPGEIARFRNILAYSKDKDFLFDDDHTLDATINRLYRAVFFYKTEKCDLSTNGAEIIKDSKTGETLFYAKSFWLFEDLGVPQNGSVGREHLYYLLDRGFAKVPPAFRVDMPKLGIRSFHWYKNDCKWWDDRNITGKVSLRKCFIHQYRTVNMDPSSPNLLTARGSDESFVFPIDGGYTLPERFHSRREPFSIGNHVPLREKPYLDEPFSEEEKTYIESIDLEKDKELVTKHCMPSQPVLKIFEVANLLLKKAAEGKGEIGITLHDLRSIREIREFSPPSKSLFEQILESQNIIERIDKVFQQIIEIKTVILSSESDLEGLKEELLSKTEDISLKAIVNYYAFGYR